MAVKIVRQIKNIALLGAPTSAATLAPGPERGPEALRAAGLSQRLTEAGFTVTDHGDSTVRAFEPDDDHPRVRGGARILAGLEELRPKIEIAVKSGALPVILGGDNTIVLATLGGLRRYYRDVSLIYVDRDAGLNEPNTTPSGNVDGMVISHVIGRGAPELVRFWREPPLLREPSVALFGVDRLDQPEQQYLSNSPLRHYLAADISRMGAEAAASQALDRVHGQKAEFVVHVDLDSIASEDFAATNLSAPGGMRWEQLRQALAFWARQPTLGAIEISCYNPALDPDGSAAKKLIDLLVEVLSPRLAPAEAPTEATGESAPQAAAASSPETKGGEGGQDVPSPLETAAQPADAPAQSDSSAAPANPTAEPHSESSEPDAQPS